MPGIQPSRPTTFPKLGVLIALVVFLLGGVLLSRYVIGTLRASQAPGALRLAVAPLQDHRAFKPMPFEVTVRTPDGLPLEGAEVRFDLTMPEMEMPLNQFDAVAVPGQPGRYRGEGSFTMGGLWQIEATARQGDKRGVARERFEIGTR